MRESILLCALVVALSGCTSQIAMRQPSTGATASCGPFIDTWTTPERERQCIQDYQRQGFERASR